MSQFQYGDEGDRLTQALISEEYDGRYWGESEDVVLTEAEKFLRERFGAERLKDLTLLDLGCGVGRLIPGLPRRWGARSRWSRIRSVTKKPQSWSRSVR